MNDPTIGDPSTAPQIGDQQDAPPQTEQATPTEGEPTEAPQLSDEDYRINFLGTDKFELPRETPEEIRTALKNLEKSLNKGWTEKNMRFAERQKELVNAFQTFEQESTAQQEMIKDVAKLTALQDAISEYDTVNWQAWAAQDSSAAQQGFINLQTLQQRQAKLKEELAGKQREIVSKQQRTAQEFLSQAEARLSSRIHDWGDDKRQAIVKFVTDSYLNAGPQADTRAMQAMSWHPGLVEMAHDAMLYRQSMSKAAQSSKPAATKPVPVQKVGGAAQAIKNPDQMTDEEWRQWRETDLANKRRAQNFRR